MTMRVAHRLLIATLVCAPALAGAQQRYWYDGETRRTLWLEPSLVADLTRQPALKSSILAPAGLEKAAPGEAAARARAPVFRDGAAPGSRLRALAPGLIVRLKPGTGAAQREALFARHGLDGVRPIGEQPGAWFVASPPELASLDLANRLHESGEFTSVSPNWWKPRVRK